MLTSWLMREGLLVALAFMRITAFILVSPFPGKEVPRSAKVGFAIFLAAVALSVHPRPTGTTLDLDVSLAPTVSGELIVGLTVGFVFRLVLLAAEVAGELFAQATGLSAPSLFDPTLGGQQSVLARGFGIFAMVLLIAAGGHRIVIGYLLDSFRAVPIGSELHLENVAQTLSHLVGQGLSLGLRLALPAIGVSLVTQAGLALVARVAPSLQLFNVGFAILIAVGLLTLLASARNVAAFLIDHFQNVGGAVDQVLLLLVS